MYIYIYIYICIEVCFFVAVVCFRSWFSFVLFLNFILLLLSFAVVVWLCFFACFAAVLFFSFVDAAVAAASRCGGSAAVLLLQLQMVHVNSCSC